MAQEVMRSTVSVSKGDLEEWTFVKHCNDPKEKITLDRSWGKEGILSYVGEESGIPEAEIENLDSDATSNKWKDHPNIL